jgi:TPR repeat protein
MRSNVADNRGIPQNNAESIKWYRLSAEQGDASAQYNLGVIYDTGDGVPENDAEAVKWFRLAAEQGLLEAQYYLGVMYANGEGVPQNEAEAVRWFRLAAEQGDADAQYNLAVMYANGEGVHQNDAEALKWYRMAAGQGYAEAQFNLGVMYDNGRAVPQDDVEAVQWYRLAAEQGLAEAQADLGVMYHNGRGVSQNHAEALKWYHLAADQGDANAQCNLGDMHRTGKGVPKSESEAVKWYRLAADQGLAEAQYNLGLLGWVAFARKSKLEELKKNGSKRTHFVEYQGKTVYLPVLRVPIGLPKYRLQNGRTLSAQKEWLATNRDKPSDFFEADPEFQNAQVEQHKLLLRLKTKELEEKFRDPAQQQVDPIILDSEGFVINGNTRLAYWRNLHHDNSSKYGHYATIDSIILPAGDEKDIDRLEAKLQIDKDIRANYSWHAEAKMVKTRLEHGLRPSEIAALFGWKDSEVARREEIWNRGDEYLKSRGKKDMWSTIDSYDSAFGALVDTMTKISGIDNQALFKQMAFILIDNREKVGSSGSVQGAIKNIREHFEKIINNLDQQFLPVPVVQGSPMVGKLGQHESAAKSVRIDEKEAAGTNAKKLTEKISKKANATSALETIVETIDRERQSAKDVKNSKYLMACCTKVYGLLQGAVQSGLNSDANLSGVEAQLAQIEVLIGNIRKHIEAATPGPGGSNA